MISGLFFFLLGAADPAQVSSTPALGPLESIPYGDVKLKEGPLKKAFDLNVRYLKSLDDDSLLYIYRMEAAQQYPGTPHGGWEAPNSTGKGSFLGHWLSAAARAFAESGDQELEAKADRIVGDLCICQRANGNGYVHGMPENWFDSLEGRRAGDPGRRVVAFSYYQMHKIMMGFLEMHQLAENAQALEALRGLADWVKKRTDELSEARMQEVLQIEYGGMQEVLLNLYAIIKDPRYLELAKRFEKRNFIDPLAEGRDILAGLHGNTHLPQICGAARRYEITGEERYRKVVSYFWDLVARTRSFATGGSTSDEHWGEANRLKDTLGPTTQEACKTYNWLKVTRYLLRWTGEARYADMCERAFYNGILTNQHPETGQFIYFLQLARAGGRKPWGTPTESFWCCYGTGVQCFASLTELVYFKGKDLLLVNLFVPSEVSWEGIRLEQETSYPEAPETRLVLHVPRPKTFTLAVRVPWWANGRTFRARVNGEEAAERALPGSFLRISREWKEGDRVEVAMPMEVRLEPLNDDPHLCAVMYGPLVLGGLTTGLVDFQGEEKAPGDWIRPVPGKPLAFEATGRKRSGRPARVEFIPLYRIVDEAYGAYFPVNAPLEEDPEYRTLRERVIDEVFIGDPESESEHALEGEGTGTGPGAGKNWRHAVSGWFSYRLKAAEAAPCVLCAQFWGDEVGPRTFDILADGKTLATVNLGRDRPGRLYWREFEVPEELLRGKKEISFRFQAHPRNIAGGVFHLMTLRRK